MKKLIKILSYISFVGAVAIWILWADSRHIIEIPPFKTIVQWCADLIVNLLLIASAMPIIMDIKEKL